MTRARGAVLPWLIALGGTAIVSAGGRALHFNAIIAGFAFLVVVLLSAVEGGLLAGTSASIAATLCYNYFFFPPLYTFVIHEPSNWVALAAFLLTSVAVSRLVIAARTEAVDAEERKNELEALYALSVDLFATTNRLGALGEAATRALAHLGAREGGLVLFEGNPYRQHVVQWIGHKPDEIEDLISGVGRHREPLEFPSRLGRDVYVPLLMGGKTTGVFAARGTRASMAALVSAARLVNLAVERDRFIEESAHVEALREGDALKTSVVRAISHDLATPLTAITLEIEALRRKAAIDAELAQPLATIESETARLRRRIDNLLAMARLEAGKSKPRPEPTPPSDLFRAVRENLGSLFAARPMKVDVADDCPDVNVDPVLALEVLVNLVENAHRVAPRDTPIELAASRSTRIPEFVRLEVRDRGPGVPPGIADADGNLLASATTDLAQRGLGLEIARSLAAANGGTIGIVPRAGGGTIAHVDFPSAPLPVLAATGAS